MQRIFPNASTEFRGKSQKNTAPSDLLIPAHLNQFIQIQIKKHKNLKNYFHYLILKFQKEIYFINSQILLSERHFINQKIYSLSVILFVPITKIGMKQNLQDSTLVFQFVSSFLDSSIWIERKIRNLRI